MHNHMEFNYHIKIRNQVVLHVQHLLSCWLCYRGSQGSLHDIRPIQINNHGIEVVGWIFTFLFSL